MKSTFYMNVCEYLMLLIVYDGFANIKDIDALLEST